MSLVKEGDGSNGIMAASESLLRRSVDTDDPEERNRLFAEAQELQNLVATGVPIDPKRILKGFRDGDLGIEDCMVIMEANPTVIPDTT